MIFCFFISRSSTWAISSSSAGTSRGSISISVTSVPIAAKKQANSLPTTPPPSTARRLGWRGRSRASWLVMTRSPSSFQPGGSEALAPVASSTCSAVSAALPPSLSATWTRPSPVSFAVPRTISTPRPPSRVLTPPVSCLTTLFLRSTIHAQLTRGSPTSMPKSRACLICS